MAISSKETQFSSRKFLLPGNLLAPAIPPAMDDIAGVSIDMNVAVILSALACAVICSLGFFCIVKCALRCSRLARSGEDHADELVNEGVVQKALKAFPTVKYSDKLILPGLVTACIICLSEFAPGELLRVLPKCNHGFHVHCIDEWLSSNSSRPTCRHCLTKTSRKVANCSEASHPGQGNTERLLS